MYIPSLYFITRYQNQGHSKFTFVPLFLKAILYCRNNKLRSLVPAAYATNTRSRPARLILSTYSSNSTEKETVSRFRQFRVISCCWPSRLETPSLLDVANVPHCHHIICFDNLPMEGHCSAVIQNRGSASQQVADWTCKSRYNSSSHTQHGHRQYYVWMLCLSA